MSVQGVVQQWMQPALPGFNHEINRLLTYPDFIQYPYKNMMARKGFYCMPNVDQLKCYFCPKFLILSEIVGGDWHKINHLNCDRISDIPLVSNYDDYSYEQNRLVSLLKQGRSKEADSEHPVGAVELARLGFYFTQDGAQCAFCPLKVRASEQLDVIRCKQLQQKCPLFSYFLSNIEIGNEKNTASRNYATYSTRLETFKDWPKNNLLPTPENLSDAGFFYPGRSDHVICYDCDVGLKNWTAKVIPLIEHKFHSPTCSHLCNVTLVQEYEHVTCVLTEEEKIADREAEYTFLDDDFLATSGWNSRMFG